MADDTSPIVWLRERDTTQPLLVLDEQDSVGVALRALTPGQLVHGVEVLQRIPKGHKMALQGIEVGLPVLKYAQSIGVASRYIGAGEHVHTDNLKFVDTEDEALRDQYSNPVQPTPTDTFDGFHRRDGRVGTRNFVAVISSVNCSATAAHTIANHFGTAELAHYPNVDGVAAFAHGTGCGLADSGEGFDNLQRVFAGLATHPNVGGVLFVGLGCEVSQVQSILSVNRLQEGPLLRTLNIQSCGGHRKTVQAGVDIVNDMLAEVNLCVRRPASAAHLSLALQCGGSDAWSGITANPALGYAADKLIGQGGTAVLAETPEIYGAEHLLMRRAVSASVAQDVLNRVHWWRDYVSRNHGSLDNNPSPGNKLGGLTTILEKSLGAVAKGGTTPLVRVAPYADRVTEKGLVFMDSPGYDPASVTGQIATGCNLVSFTTGRGSTFGSKPSPCLKIATNTDMYNALSEDMDINAGTIVSDNESVADVGERIYRRLLEVASGDRTFSEQHGLGDNEFVPWQIGATM